MPELLYSEKTRKIIDSFCQVLYKFKAFQGYPPEAVRTALAVELTKQGFRVQKQVMLTNFYGGQRLNIGYADLIVDNEILLSINRTVKATPHQINEVQSFMKVRALKVALILCYGGTKPGFKRIDDPENWRRGED